MGSPIIFRHVGKAPYSRASNIWLKQANKKCDPFWNAGKRWENLIKIISHFNTQTYKPMASPASFLHVGQASFKDVVTSQ